MQTMCAIMANKLEVWVHLQHVSPYLILRHRVFLEEGIRFVLTQTIAYWTILILDFTPNCMLKWAWSNIYRTKKRVLSMSAVIQIDTFPAFI